MPQLVLPIFSPECKHINNQVGFQKIKGRIYYFHGLLPVFSHDEDDLESFRFITSQLVINGNVKQKEIVKAFGISAISVKRYVKRLAKCGSKGFFRQAKARSAHVLTADIKRKAEEEQPPEPARNKSERNVIDSQASMGLGCTREQDRVDAAFGELDGAKPVFGHNQDVKSAESCFAFQHYY